MAPRKVRQVALKAGNNRNLSEAGAGKNSIEEQRGAAGARQRCAAGRW